MRCDRDYALVSEPGENQVQALRGSTGPYLTIAVKTLFAEASYTVDPYRFPFADEKVDFARIGQTPPFMISWVSEMFKPYAWHPQPFFLSKLLPGTF